MGESISEKQETLLKLPESGKTATWITGEGDDKVTHTATLVKLQIEVNGENQTVSAIRDVQKDHFGTVIKYWIKGMGLVFYVQDTKVSQYNSSVGLTKISYKTVQ